MPANNNTIMKFTTAYKNNIPILELSNQFNISKSSVYRWIKKYCAPAKLPCSTTEYRTLLCKEARHRQAVEIFQITGLGLSSPFEEKVEAITNLLDKYSLTLLCETLGVSKATYYRATREKEETTYEVKRREMLPVITKIFNDSNQTLGAAKITAILHQEGYHISSKLVADIMHKNNLFSMRAGAKALYKQGLCRKENILQQQFTVSRPNEVWVSDVSEFKYDDTKYYICVMLDLFSRKIVSYHISTKNSTQLTNRTFIKGYNSRQPTESLMLHTDRGANYTSKAFNTTLKKLGIKHSYSAPGRPYDNSVCESFFTSIKQEEIYRREYYSEKRMHNSIERYIEYYNTKRPHVFLRYKTPDDFENDYRKNCD